MRRTYRSAAVLSCIIAAGIASAPTGPAEPHWPPGFDAGDIHLYGIRKTRTQRRVQPDMAPPLLQLKDIGLTFGGTPLLTGAELSVSPGERVSLVGRNGS